MAWVFILLCGISDAKRFYLNVKINARSSLPEPFTTEKDALLKRTSPLLFAVIAFIVGLNLRPILASVGPLFSVLQREAGLTAMQFSLLTTLLGGPSR